jgi:hypothetical protein
MEDEQLEQVKKKHKSMYNEDSSGSEIYYPPMPQYSGIKRVSAFHDLTRLVIDHEFMDRTIAGEVNVASEK